MKTLFILLDVRHHLERRTRRPLIHNGGKILMMCINRLSIPREAWVHNYCYIEEGNLPRKKKERQSAMRMNVHRIREAIRSNAPCVVVGMGKLSCEVLTNASLVSSKAGTWWDTKDFGKVWITYSPEAALFDPSIVVDIYGVLANAATEAGIPIKFNPNAPIFDWREYSHSRI